MIIGAIIGLLQGTERRQKSQEEVEEVKDNSTEVLHEKNKDSVGGLSGTESVKTCTNDGMEEKMVKRSNRAFERAWCITCNLLPAAHVTALFTTFSSHPYSVNNTSSSTNYLLSFPPYNSHDSTTYFPSLTRRTSFSDLVIKDSLQAEFIFSTCWFINSASDDNRKKFRGRYHNTIQFTRTSIATKQLLHPGELFKVPREVTDLILGLFKVP
ncbi:uncharacterized protein IAS62_002967 [Cryptococcus decagattii]|uniref:Uncharacterized protein n=1 Tax=Cryptococcus decagattii TaxID=1859122 RepID=A0ABZ2ATE7_9TREE